jgi:hypothetical protein
MHQGALRFRYHDGGEPARQLRNYAIAAKWLESQQFLVLPVRIELTTSPLPRGCSTTELRQRSSGEGCANHGRKRRDPCHKGGGGRKRVSDAQLSPARTLPWRGRVGDHRVSDVSWGGVNLFARTHPTPTLATLVSTLPLQGRVGAHGSGKPLQMLLRGCAGVLPGRQFHQHLLDPLGGEVLLRQRHAAAEGLGVARDQAIVEREE